VDIERGDEVVRRLRRLVPGIGDFGGRFPLDLGGIARPVLVAGADGVGTKVRIAIESGIHDTIGIDLVAMNVNDVICSGARPLFFLDYIAAARIDPAIVETIVGGMLEGCRRAECVLLGGETAEMPGIYADGDYDLAGFAVGIADAAALWGPERLREGDVLLGLASDGLHSNGYSLARQVLVRSMDEPFGGGTVRDALRVPTRLYVKALRRLAATGDVRAAAHITGGGIPGNAIRILPDGLGLVIDRAAWEVPPLFRLIEKKGGIADEEMCKTFNMGIGMIVAIGPERSDAAIRLLEEEGETVFEIGRVVRGEGLKW
jgi:phosphoribosylformylglycinamidine cyclo-ligase